MARRSVSPQPVDELPKSAPVFEVPGASVHFVDEVGFYPAEHPEDLGGDWSTLGSAPLVLAPAGHTRPWRAADFAIFSR